MPPEKHYYFIDLIRIIAFLSIVMIHTATVTYESFPSIARLPWLISLALSYGLRFSTPLFIMISGYLFLRSERSGHLKYFYLKRASRIIVPLIFWNIFYYFFYCYFNGVLPGYADFWGKFIGGGTYFHLYFLFLITGLYLITPLIKKILPHLQPNIVVPAILLFSSLYYYASIWLKIPSLNSSTTLFILYIGYYLAGYWVSTWHFSRPYRSIVLIAGCLGLAIFLSSQFISRFGIYDQGTFLANRLSLLIVVPTLLIFQLMLNLGNQFFVLRNLACVEKIALLSMGVYLVHPIFVKLFSILPPLNWLLVNLPVLWIFIAYTLSVAASMIIVLIFKKLPFLKFTVN